MSKSPIEGKKGFTLIELLIVIGVLGILAGIILVAVDPAKRLQQARDARRFSEVNGLLNAILNYTVDNDGVLPNNSLFVANATGTRYQLGTATGTTAIGIAGGCATISCSSEDVPAALDGSVHEACLDFTDYLVDEYIAEIPVDPAASNANDTFDASRTGYYVTRSNNGRVEVGSCNSEIEAEIKIKR